MKAEGRQIKINLQIKHKRKIMQESPLPTKPTSSVEATRATNNQPKQLLHLTITRKGGSKAKVVKNPEKINAIKVSQFELQQPDVNWNLFPKEIVLTEREKATEPSTLQVSTVFPDKESSSRWWEELKRKQQQTKQVLLNEISKKQIQIEFYQQLLNTKEQECKAKRIEKVQQYERYLQNLIELYQQEIEKGNYLQKMLQQKNQNERYQKTRRNINLQGKMGLNFSPKCPSLFRGVSDSPLLSSCSSSLQKSFNDCLFRDENFSFGSKTKANKSLSSQKLLKTGFFLNPGRACLLGKRKINFDQS